MPAPGALPCRAMRFAKYQGTGNDFVMIADLDDRLKLTPELVKALCDRRFGIGADGVIRVAPGTDGGELFMDYVNSDGSVGEMCGNGIRCLALFARELGLTSSEELKVGTPSGVKLVRIVGDGVVEVDMGPPVFEPSRIPVHVDCSDALHVTLHEGGDEVEATSLSMGNPHAVIFVQDPDRIDVANVGPRLEHNERFPNGANVEFVAVESPGRIRMRVWERGSGETLACGTGACAAAVAARLLRGTDETVTVVLPGGEVEVEWVGSLDVEAPVLMTGPAVKSYDGELDLDAFAKAAG